MFVAIFIIFLTTYICYHRLKIELFRKRTRIPLPPNCYPLIGHSLIVKRNLNENCNTLSCLRRQYPDIFSLWMGPLYVVFPSEPRYIETIMNESRNMEKGYQYKFLKPWFGDSILTSVGKKYLKNKKIIAKEFYTTRFKEYATILTQQSRLIVDDVAEKEIGKEFNLLTYLSLYTMRGLMRTIFGVDLDITSSEIWKSAKAIEETGHIVYKRSGRFWLFPEIIYRYSSLKVKQDECLKILNELVDRIVSAKKLKNPNDEFLCLEGMRDEIMALIVAGEDTTSGTLGFILSILGIYHDVQEKVVEELNEILPHNHDVITYEDVQNMKYIEQVVHETLRLYPSIPMIAKRTVKDLNLGDNYVIPKNTTVLFFLPMIHRNPQTFPEPEKFNPENFSPENCKQRHPYGFIPFSANCRSCIGSKFAMISIKIFLATFLRKFKIFGNYQMDDFNLGMGATLTRREGFLVRVALREK